MRRISLCFFVLVSLSIIMSFACLLKLWFFSQKCLHNDEQCSSQNHISIIWFWVQDVLNNFCGYLAVYWKQSLPFLPIVFYTGYTPLNIWHTHYNNKLREKSSMFLSLLTLEIWCCYDLVTAQIYSICKTRIVSSASVYFLYNAVLDFFTADEFPDIFVLFESRNWFVLKNLCISYIYYIYIYIYIWLMKINTIFRHTYIYRYAR